MDNNNTQNLDMRRHKIRVILIATIPVLAVILILTLLAWWRFAANDTQPAPVTNLAQPVNEISLNELLDLPAPTLQIPSGNKLVVNGQLTANKAVVLSPGEQPADPLAGTLYFDVTLNQFRYYDGDQYVELPYETDTRSICYIGADCGFLTAADLPDSLTLPQPLAVTDFPTFAGLTITNDLSVTSGGTGHSSFSNNALILGNGNNPLKTTNTPVAGQIVVVNASGVPTFVGMGGDVSITATGITGLANNTVDSSELVDTGVTAGVYGNGSAYPIVTVDADGRITNVSTQGLGLGGSVTSLNTLAGDLTINGTANQVIVNDNGSDTITLSLPQSINTGASPTFASIDTGQGAYELYAMNQDVRTGDNVGFNNISAGGTLSSTGDANFDANTIIGNAITDTLTINSLIQGGTPFVFEGVTPDANQPALL